MTLEQVKYLRDLHSDGLVIFADNAKLVNENSEGTYILWDDSRELVHIVRPNTNYYNQSKKPMYTESFAYEIIQYICSADDIDTITTVLNTIKPDILNPEKIEEILKYFKK